MQVSCATGQADQRLCFCCVDIDCLNSVVSISEVVSYLGFNPKVDYYKVPKFSDTRKLRCNLPKIQTKRPNLKVFLQKNANGIANSEDPD